MPLSVKLNDVLLTRPCPRCGHNRKKLGKWFQVIRHYQCEGCGTNLPMTYPDKIALFKAHDGVITKPNQSQTEAGEALSDRCS